MPRSDPGLQYSSQSSLLLGKGVLTGNGLANDERVDVVRAFVGVDRLQIVGVAADGIFQGDAIRAENGTGLTRRFEGLTDIIALSKRNLDGIHPPPVVQPP